MFKVKMLVHVLCALPLSWLSITLLFGDGSQLGADPIKETIHFLGFVALTLFIIIFIFKLCLSILNKNRLQLIHQTIGLWAFTYMILHIISYLALELGGDFVLFVNELLTRGYLIVGGFAFLILLLIVLSSSIPYIKNKLGKKWAILHQLYYVALLAAATHYYWSLKSIELIAVIYLVLVIIILFFKIIKKKII